MSRSILLVDDDRTLLDTLALGLRKRGYEATPCASAEAALEALAVSDVDVVVTDLQMPGTKGLDLCASVASAHRDVPVIVLTAFGSYESAIGAIRAGAYDFMSKPVQLDVLGIALERAIEHRALHREVRRLRSDVATRGRFDELLGTSPAMNGVCEMLERIAETDTSVLVTGETGSGKEVVARALHRRSRRRNQPFVAVNCAAMPEALLESELFGHAKGAFTDAHHAKPGLFVQARGGTVFLDEIGDMPLALQPKLLRALQEKRVRPVGSNAEIPIDVRFVAATNKDLETAVEEKRFREDLFFRIAVIHVEVPPLRARAGDVLPMAQHFLRQFAERCAKNVTGISPAAAQALLAYSWPGNVRELQNCIERAVALTRLDEVGIDDLPDRVRKPEPANVVVAPSTDPNELVSLEELEKRYILQVLDAVGGNKTAAARVLGVERKTLYRKLERYGVAPS